MSPHPSQKESGSFSNAIALVSAFLLTGWLAFSQPSGLGTNALAALVGALIFALVGWGMHGVSYSGARAGFFVAFIFLASDGWRLFSPLLCVFALTLLATRVGATRKRSMGLAELPQGRSASQVMANLFVTTACIVLWRLKMQGGVALAAGMAALAEAAADTVSSEVGEAFAKRTILITSFKSVSPGTDGGISAIGTGAAIFAASLIAVSSLLVLPGTFLWKILGAGFIGSLTDSVLGATLERRGIINNDVVNLLGTTVAAGLVFVVP